MTKHFSLSQQALSSFLVLLDLPALAQANSAFDGFYADLAVVGNQTAGKYRFKSVG